MTLQTIGILLTGITMSTATIYSTLTIMRTIKNQELALKAQEKALEILESRREQVKLQMNLLSTLRSIEFQNQRAVHAVLR
ncbi:MAG: hypothetical protein ACFFDT_23220 [Candidatus Hodarchaeota archaeon]